MTDYTSADLEALGAKWLQRLEEAEKRDDAFFKTAAEAEAIYAADKTGEVQAKQYDFNILHSNIETIVPAIYNSAPAPDIRERFRSGDVDPNTSMSRQIAQVVERAIMVQVDDGAMDTELEDLSQDAMLAGRGVIRVKFEAQADPEQGVLAGERLLYEAVSWRDYREGPAKRWRDVPWVAYRHFVSQEAIERIQDPELRDVMESGQSPDDGPKDTPPDSELWEIWCKETRKVYMITAGSGRVIKVTDDPLGLSGFFPSAKPVQPITLTGKRQPVTPFAVYQKLADELETLTRRISAITAGMKVRGFIVGDAGDLEALADADDNTLIPVSGLEGLAQTGGLDQAISWWPLDQAVNVLNQLFVSREQTKGMIYEVTGISDIVRGQSSASETATAQQIKSEWGSLRIKKLQRQVERCVRDLFVISAELICSKFSEPTLAAMTGVQFQPGTFPMKLDGYRIDVESDSTIRADLTRRKGEVGEFLAGTGTFFQTMAPVVQQAPMIAGPVAEIYASFARMFNLGKQAEDAIEQMVAGMKGAAEQAQQSQAQQAEQAAQAQQMAMQSEQEKLALEQQKLQIEGQAKQADVQIKGEELQLKKAELALKAQEQQRAAIVGDREFERAGREAEGRLEMEREGQRMAAGMPPDFSYAADRDVQQQLLASIAEGQRIVTEALSAQTAALTEQAQASSQQTEQVTAAMQMVAKTLSAPKRIVRGADGRPEGMETVTDG